MSATRLAVLYAVLLIAPAYADQPSHKHDPYSCRLLDDEMRKCSFDPHCDRRVVERLRQECLRDGIVVDLIARRTVSRDERTSYSHPSSRL
jgi:hypothetical protein